MPEKECSKCGGVKPLEAFSLRPSGNRRSDCKPCGAERSRQWNRANSEYAKARARLRRYGLTPAEYEAMVDAQDGRCAICHRKPTATLHVDHNHTTGRVRALLCGGCNLKVGVVENNRFDDYVAYLAQYEIKAVA